MLFFTSDTHFGNNSNGIIIREMRPFNNPIEYKNKQIEIFNSQASNKDIIYHLGDFCNYNKGDHDWKSGIETVKEINAKIILIIGNNEERVIQECFNNDFNKFREFCLEIGFLDVKRDDIIYLNNIPLYLNHRPSKHRDDMLNLFGHTHKSTGLYKSFGINLGIDLNNFKLYSEKDVLTLIEYKRDFWDGDLEVLS